MDLTCDHNTLVYHRDPVVALDLRRRRELEQAEVLSAEWSVA